MQDRRNEDLTAAELIQILVRLRFLARKAIIGRRTNREQLAYWRGIRDANGATSAEAENAVLMLEALGECDLELKFREIKIGQTLVILCDELDKKASREAVFDALNTNKAHRKTDMVRQYGSKTSHLISVLDLENSATPSDEIEVRPLKWCKTMAMFHAMETNPKLDRAMHDGANEFFNGALGEYRERPLTERLIGAAV